MTDLDTGVQIRPVAFADRDWVRERLVDSWGSTEVVARGRAHDASRLPGLVAERDDERVGVVTYHPTGGRCEVVTLNSYLPGHGIGTRLLDALKERALEQDWDRLWLVVTNDDTPALRFYQRRGWEIVAVHLDAAALARKVRPQLPEHGVDGIRIRHEIELAVEVA